MLSQLELIFAMLFAYLCGSLSSAVIVCRLLNLPDPRQEGSRNPGTTNVLRLGGKKAAVLTLLGDVVKGILPIVAAKLVGMPLLSLTLIGFAAFLGHLYPIFFGFVGGKGVATAFGVLLTLCWPVGLISFFIWLSIAAIFRYSSLAALMTAITMPFIFYCYTWNLLATAIIALMCFWLIVRHRENIQRLLNGTEKKIGKRV